MLALPPRFMMEKIFMKFIAFEASTLENESPP